MSITYKNPQEIKILLRGGRLLAAILRQIAAAVKPGVTTRQLDELAEKLITEAGGRPSFKNYRYDKNDPYFPSSLCASVNEELVHAPASEKILKSGDIVGLDLGMEYEGLYTDAALTVPVGKITPGLEKLIKITKKCLDLAIRQVKPGNYISHIARAVEDCARKNGLAVVRDLVGHGVGYAVHEDPRVPNFYSPRQPVIELKPGLVIAIEPMLNLGEADVYVLKDGWTVVTADGLPCAHFEHTVAVTENGCLVITK